MKVVVPAVSFSPDLSGVQRHAFNVVRCLLQRPEIEQVHLVVAPWQSRLAESFRFDGGGRLAIHAAGMREGALHRNYWYYRGLPKLAAALRTDLVHLSYPVPVDAASMPCPTVVTLHDLYPYEIPRNFRFPHVLLNRLVLRHCLLRAGAIVCVSQATMQRMQEYLPRSTSEKAVQISNCVEPESGGAFQTPFGGWSGEPFLLSVAQHRRNKNIALLLRGFHRLVSDGAIGAAMKLVVVGIFGPETKSIRRLIVEMGLTDRVLLLRGISEATLQWCYAHCEALVVPSKTEGFGLPVAEALLVGCRIVCSDIPAFREIGGEHCRLVQLGVGEEKALAQAIRDILEEPRPGPVALPHLGSGVLGEAYVRLYQQLIEARGAVSPKTFAASNPIPAETIEGGA